MPLPDVTAKVGHQQRTSLGDRVRERQRRQREEAERVLAVRQRQKELAALQEKRELVDHYRNYSLPSGAAPDAQQEDLQSLIQKNERLLADQGAHIEYQHNQPLKQANPAQPIDPRKATLFTPAVPPGGKSSYTTSAASAGAMESERDRRLRLRRERLEQKRLQFMRRTSQLEDNYEQPGLGVPPESPAGASWLGGASDHSARGQPMDDMFAPSNQQQSGRRAGYSPVPSPAALSNVSATMPVMDRDAAYEAKRRRHLSQQQGQHSALRVDPPSPGPSIQPPAWPPSPSAPRSPLGLPQSPNSPFRPPVSPGGAGGPRSPGLRGSHDQQVFAAQIGKQLISQSPVARRSMDAVGGGQDAVNKSGSAFPWQRQQDSSRRRKQQQQAEYAATLQAQMDLKRQAQLTETRQQRDKQIGARQSPGKGTDPSPFPWDQKRRSAAARQRHAAAQKYAEQLQAQIRDKERMQGGPGYPQQQQQQPQQQYRDSQPELSPYNRAHRQPADDSGGGGGGGGGGPFPWLKSDDRRKRAQQEHARMLRQQMEQQAQQHQRRGARPADTDAATGLAAIGSQGGGGLDFGRSPGKRGPRHKQSKAEYARVLRQQMEERKQRQAREKARRLQEEQREARGDQERASNSNRGGGDARGSYGSPPYGGAGNRQRKVGWADNAGAYDEQGGRGQRRPHNEYNSNGQRDNARDAVTDKPWLDDSDEFGRSGGRRGTDNDHRGPSLSPPAWGDDNTNNHRGNNRRSGDDDMASPSARPGGRRGQSSGGGGSSLGGLFGGLGGGNDRQRKVLAQQQYKRRLEQQMRERQARKEREKREKEEEEARQEAELKAFYAGSDKKRASLERQQSVQSNVGLAGAVVRSPVAKSGSRPTLQRVGSAHSRFKADTAPIHVKEDKKKKMTRIQKQQEALRLQIEAKKRRKEEEKRKAEEEDRRLDEMVARQQKELEKKHRREIAKEKGIELPDESDSPVDHKPSARSSAAASSSHDDESHGHRHSVSPSRGGSARRRRHGRPGSSARSITTSPSRPDEYQPQRKNSLDRQPPVSPLSSQASLWGKGTQRHQTTGGGLDVGASEFAKLKEEILAGQQNLESRIRAQEEVMMDLKRKADMFEQPRVGLDAYNGGVGQPRAASARSVGVGSGRADSDILRDFLDRSGGGNVPTTLLDDDFMGGDMLQHETSRWKTRPPSAGARLGWDYAYTRGSRFTAQNRASGLMRTIPGQSVLLGMARSSQRANPLEASLHSESKFIYPDEDVLARSVRVTSAGATRRGPAYNNTDDAGGAWLPGGMDAATNGAPVTAWEQDSLQQMDMKQSLAQLQGHSGFVPVSPTGSRPATGVVRPPSGSKKHTLQVNAADMNPLARQSFEVQVSGDRVMARPDTMSSSRGPPDQNPVPSGLPELPRSESPQLGAGRQTLGPPSSMDASGRVSPSVDPNAVRSVDASLASLPRVKNVPRPPSPGPDENYDDDFDEFDAPTVHRKVVDLTGADSGKAGASQDRDLSLLSDAPSFNVDSVLERNRERLAKLDELGPANNAQADALDASLAPTSDRGSFSILSTDSVTSTGSAGANELAGQTSKWL